MDLLGEIIGLDCGSSRSVIVECGVEIKEWDAIIPHCLYLSGG